MNKEYRFKIINTGKCIEGSITYEDYGFNFVSSNIMHCDIFSLLIGYQELDFTDYTNRAECFWGFNDYRTWLYATLHFPKFQQGELYIINNIKEKIFKDEEYVEHWPTYYDREKNIICIGDYKTKETDQTVEFCTNIVAVLEGQYLKAVWIKDCEFLDVNP